MNDYMTVGNDEDEDLDAENGDELEDQEEDEETSD